MTQQGCRHFVEAVQLQENRWPCRSALTAWWIFNCRAERSQVRTIDHSPAPEPGGGAAPGLWPSAQGTARRARQITCLAAYRRNQQISSKAQPGQVCSKATGPSERNQGGLGLDCPFKDSGALLRGISKPSHPKGSSGRGDLRPPAPTP